MSQADVERRHLRAQNVDVIMRPQIDVQQRAVGVTHVGNSITGSEYVGRLQVGRLAQEEDDTLLGDQDPELGQDEGPTEMSANEVVSTPSARTPDLNSSATTSSRLLLIPSTSMPSRGTRYTLRITLKDRPDTPATLRVKVDTGAQGNVMPLRTFQRMYPSNIDTEGIPVRGSLEHRDTILTAYNGQLIRQYGTTRLKCVHETTTHEAEFFVADTPGPVILGLPSCRKLNLVTLNCAVSEHPPPLNSKEDLQRLYPDCFKGIGKFRETFHITLDPAVTPVVHAPRRCPIHIKDDVRNEINQMVELGVIEKVEEPTDWVSSIVYSRKSNGKLRICLDPKDLNTAIKRPHYPTPTLEEITHEFAGSMIFSKLDARHGYWSVQLDDESKRLTTFNSPFGRYCFRRLPFGLNLSQDVFQERMDCILEKCPGTISIADDVGVFGKTEAEHDKHLHNLMRVALQHGLVFNIDKCDIKQANMKFFGLEFSADGVRPDPGKAADIQRMKEP